MGYKLGQAIDRGVGALTGKELSTHLSERMVGTVDDDLRDAGHVVQSQRGTAGIAQANRAQSEQAIAYATSYPRQVAEHLEAQRHMAETAPFGDLWYQRALAMGNWAE
jgi:hypothetical protein